MTIAHADAGRRGTQHLGLLILRVGLGVVLGAHGLQKLFGWWGGHGMTGFKNSLSDVGYQHADILAYVSAGGEIVAGVLLVLGLFTPVAAAGALAFLINGLLAAVSAQAAFAHFLVLPARRARIPDHLDRGRRRGDPVWTWPLRPRRRPGLGTSALHRVVRGAAGRYRRRYRRMGAAQRRESDRLTRSRIRVGNPARADFGQLRQRRESDRGQSQLCAALEPGARPGSC